MMWILAAVGYVVLIAAIVRLCGTNTRTENRDRVPSRCADIPLGPQAGVRDPESGRLWVEHGPLTGRAWSE